MRNRSDILLRMVIGSISRSQIEPREILINSEHTPWDIPSVFYEHRLLLCYPELTTVCSFGKLARSPLRIYQWIARFSWSKKTILMHREFIYLRGAEHWVPRYSSHGWMKCRSSGQRRWTSKAWSNHPEGWGEKRKDDLWYIYHQISLENFSIYTILRNEFNSI